MSDSPQPAPAPYEEGDKVRVYLAADDPDCEWHDTVCRVVAVVDDDLAKETGRGLDGVLYRVEDVESGERVPVDFRHRDLVPADE
ncbi:hypothetical protein PNP85_06315 [Halobacterium salinarum]|uniref:hypothetical protein n=1 Tax=Halobacterium salinarum TaxID=2242 RepID=UPI0025573800|nr:hypothetical protein [Halobacterium salinarum]MDL0139115.1 hypothetical protein [Halobacterium salinarum]